MIEINLVPDVKQELIQAQRTRAIVVSFSIIAGLAAVGVVVILAMYVFGVQTVRNAFVDNAIKEGSEKLQAVEDLPKVLTIQNQLATIQTISENRQINSRIFDMLAAVIPPKPNEVKVSSLSSDAETTTLRIDGQTPTYDSLEIFKKTLDGAVVNHTVDGAVVTEDLASDISLGDISYGEDTSGKKVLRFTLSFTYPEVLFSAKAPSINVKLTNAGNVTDSYLGVPKSIFVDQPQEDQ